MGYLKGRWSSLRGLRCNINDRDSHISATLWIAACIHLHNFALGHEQNEHPESDCFFLKGQQYIQEDKVQYEIWRQHEIENREQLERDYNDEEEIELLEGKLMRENLKKELFRYLNV